VFTATIADNWATLLFESLKMDLRFFDFDDDDVNLLLLLLNTDDVEISNLRFSAFSSKGSFYLKIYK